MSNGLETRIFNKFLIIVFGYNSGYGIPPDYTAHFCTQLTRHVI